MSKTIYKEEKTIYWNRIQFELNLPCVKEWNISENFDFITKPFVFTIGVYEIMKIDLPVNDNNSNVEILKDELIKTIVKEIIINIYLKAKETKLDYLQRLSINWCKCWIIDNGSDICLLLPSEY